MIKELAVWTVDRDKNHDGYSYAGAKLIESLQRIGIKVKHNEPSHVGIAFTLPIDYKNMESDIKIGYSPWETDTIPPYWVPIMNDMDMILTTSGFCRNTFKKNGIRTPVHVLNHGIDKKEFTLSKRKCSIHAPFMFMHQGAPAPRKNVDMVAKAFNEVFGKNDKAWLYIKSVGDPGVDLSNFDNGRIIVDTRIVSIEELNQRYHFSHCMVYPSCGEGFGLIPFQSIATGMPTLLVDWGGVKEYSRYGIPIRYRLGPTKDEYLIGRWAIPSYEDLCEKMLSVYNNRKENFDLAYQNAKALRGDPKFDWGEIAKNLVSMIGDEKMTITSEDVPKKGKPASEVFSGKEETKEPKKAAKTKKVVEILPEDDKVLLKMLSENFSYETPEGVVFTKQHPFQLVSDGEADILIRTRQFMYADPKEVEEFYAT
jgi:glycosyltransferase involved in cell wall biosynthesis